MNQEWNSLARQMDEWTRAMDRFMDRMQQVACAQRPMSSLALEGWRPAINIYETQENVVVLIELAGINPEDITITIDAHQLLIQGQRPNLIPEGAQRLHQIEICSGMFAFSVPLPTQVEHIEPETQYKAGLLEVKLTRHPAKRSPDHQGSSQDSVNIHIHTHGEV